MNTSRWAWFLILGVFYLGLAGIAYFFYEEAAHVRTFRIDESISGEFEANDFVTWRDTDQGVVVARVHPLQNYRALEQQKLARRDRVMTLDGESITKAEVIENILKAKSPKSPTILYRKVFDRFTRTYGEEEYLYLFGGYRLSFSYNEYGVLWQSEAWIFGIATFLALVILVILIPLIRSNASEFFTLLSTVISALLFFLLQLAHHFYLIFEAQSGDAGPLIKVGPEKVFILLYMSLLFAYSIFYFHFKNRHPRFGIVFSIPSMVLGAYLLLNAYQIIYLEQSLRHFHMLIENLTAVYFLWHLIGAAALFLVGADKKDRRREWVSMALIIAISASASAYFLWIGSSDHPYREYVWLGLSLLLFYPLINASFLQLQFGKVSLVVNRTLQSLVTFLLALILYFAVVQLLDYLNLNIEYRRTLEFIVFVGVFAVFGFIYRANEDKFRRYFVSTQRERINRFRAFIARIPRYTSSETLINDLQQQLSSFFTTETTDVWWKDKRSMQLPELQVSPEYIYHQLVEEQGVWSKTKEISPTQLEDVEEKALLMSKYHLIAPITIDEEQTEMALLLLGKKKRGVYNLSDLELISQLVQQTQLTLNILQLNEREKELMQQTYEANLTALRSQINPHFLFNTLNSIGELVYESAEKAEKAVEKLAYIFRFTLDKSSENFMSIGEEMKLIVAYLELEKIRFGDRLTVYIELEDEIKDVQVPSFIVNTLVENTIKHGISKIMHPGQVSVRAFKEGEFLVCEVMDNGPGIDVSRIYSSHGLSNSISRVENIYDMKDLMYFENTGNGTLVRLRIPLAYEVTKS